MIGVFDSGLGGLSVLSAALAAVPKARFCYVADFAYMPYGSRTAAQIEARVLAIADALVSQGARMLVVACNTATVTAITALRARHPQIPVVGVEPGVKPAAQATRSGRIAVLVTESTARSERLRQLIALHASGVSVQVVPCPGWATAVEQLQLGAPELHADIAARVLPQLAAGVDQLVLGCTHYGFLRGVLQPLVAGQASLVEVATPVAARIAQLHAAQAVEDAPFCTGMVPRVSLLATADPQRLECALGRLGLDPLLGEIADVSMLKV